MARDGFLRSERVLAVTLMVLSGYAGLGYQIIWTEQCALFLGHDAAAVLAVVAAFFGGMGVGAIALGRRIEQSASPARWYAGAELVIALTGALLSFALGPIGRATLALIGPEPAPLWHWLVAFGSTFVVLLPATVAMGATLPAMHRITSRTPGSGVAMLYAANTFGAMLGVLLTAFWLIPAFGLRKNALVCGALNLGCALLAWRSFGQGQRAAPPTTDRAVESNRVAERRPLQRLALTGFLGIGYEVLVVRALSEVTENTVYTFAVLLALYLAGTAAGAAAYQRWAASRERAELRDSLLAALSGACAFGMISLWSAEGVRSAVLGSLGTGVTAALLAEAAPALLAFGPATFVMGALFAELAREASAAGVAFSRALGVNTLGAALAPAMFGVLIVPAIGLKFSLVAICVGYLALVSASARFRVLTLSPAGVIAIVCVLAPALAFVEVPEGGHVVSYRDGVLAAVSVVEDVDGVARLRINDRAQEGTNRTQRVDGRQAWLPLLLHPAPSRALFLGLGTGTTAASAAEDPSLKADAVELLPEVVEAAGYFARSFEDGAPFARLHVVTADARRYVRSAAQDYDVIISDNFHPARSGSGALYTVEHFQAVKARLAAGGLFCQWLPLHQLDRETLRSIVRSFIAVYPHGSAILASNSLETPVLGLIGQSDDARFAVPSVTERFARATLPARLTSIGLEDEFSVLGSFVAGPRSLAHLAAGAPENTDDRPIVAYRAPNATYAPEASPADRLIGLLHELSLEPGEILAPSTDPSWSRRLAAYWAARNQFIASGKNVRPLPRVEDMLAQVREPLLTVLRTSPDFRPAYDPLLGMASALARSNVSAARALLVELARLQPARSEASEALASLSAHATDAEPTR